MPFEQRQVPFAALDLVSLRPIPDNGAFDRHLFCACTPLDEADGQIEV